MLKLYDEEKVQDIADSIRDLRGVNDNVKYTISQIPEAIRELTELREEIDNVLPSATATGESITVNDSAEWKGSLEVAGNNKQETRDGKNKINHILLTTKTINGLTVTNNNNGTYTINGTATAQTILAVDNLLLDTVKKYKLSGCPSDGSSSTYYIAGANFTDYGSGSSYAVPNRNTNIAFSIVIQNGTVCSNLVFKPMLAETENTEFEPYGISPSPEYPSEVETVGKPYNYLPYPYYHTTQTTNGVTITDNGDGTLTLNGTATANVTFGIMGNYSAQNQKPINGTYLSGGYSNNITVRALNHEGSSYVILGISTGTPVKLDLSTYKKGYIELFVASGTVCNNIVIKPMLTNIPDLPYQPYGKGNVTIETSNKNEFDSNAYIIQKKCAYNSSGNAVNWANYIGVREFIKLKENATYTASISTKKGASVVVFYDKNQGILSTEKNKSTFTTPANTKYIRICWYDVNEELPAWCQIEEGSTATPYEPHKGETITLPLQKEMLLGDSFEKIGGVWKEKHSWGKVVLDGTEDWLKHGSIEGWFYIDNLFNGFYDNERNDYLFSDRYVQDKYSIVGTITNGKFVYGTPDGGTRKRLVLKNTSFNDVTAFKNDLIANHVTIYYKLAETEYIDCTPEQFEILEQLAKIKTYKNVTHVNNDSIAIMTLDYKKDIESLIK